METKIEIKKIFKNVWSVLQGVMRSEMKSIRYEIQSAIKEIMFILLLLVGRN